jgi:hypothetical protein
LCNNPLHNCALSGKGQTVSAYGPHCGSNLYRELALTGQILHIN